MGVTSNSQAPVNENFIAAHQAVQMGKGQSRLGRQDFDTPACQTGASCGKANTPQFVRPCQACFQVLNRPLQSRMRVV